MYIDLLTKIKNAQASKKEGIKTIYSKMDERILGVLKSYNYISDFEKKGRGAKRVLDVVLKYDQEGGIIRGINFVSRPSCRIYVGYRDIRYVRRGYGISVLSTPLGILSNKDAKKNKVGGEILFE